MPAALLSREAETAALDAALARAAAGEGAVVLLEGPAGIGKTALLQHARDGAAGAGLRVLSARASELDRGFAYGVVHQLVGPALAEPGARASLLQGAAARAAALLDPEAEASEEQAYALQLALYWLVANLAEGGPLVLLVDDLQWADLPSLRFVEYLGRRVDGLPVVVVATVRTGDPGAPTDLLAEIAQGPSALSLRPEPLDLAAVERVLATGLGASAVGDGFARAAFRSTGGNPLLVSILAREAATASLAGRDDEGARLLALGGRGVATVVARRLRPLGAGATAVSRAVAVSGQRGTVEDLATLAGLEVAAVRVELDRLVDAEVLQPGGGFVHPLVGAAVLDGCPGRELSRLHRLAARLLRERGARPGEVAVHWLAAEPAGDPQAVDDLLRSATAAAAEGSLETAITHLRRGLAEPPTPEQRPTVLLELGDAEVRAQLPEGPDRLREALALLPRGNGSARARAALGNQLVHTDPVAALDEVGRGLEEADDPGLQLRLEAFMLESLIFPDAFADARRSAFELGRADPSPSPVMLVHLAVDGACAGRPAPEVRALAERAVADGGVVEQVGPASSTWNLLTHSFRFVEDRDRAAQVLEEGERIVVDRGLVSARFFIEQSWGYWHRDFGSVAVGAARAQLGHATIRELGLELTIPALAAIAAENLAHLNRLDEAAQHIDRGFGPAENTYMEPFTISARALVRLLVGRHEAAEADLRRGLALEAERGWSSPHATRARQRLAEVLLATGRPTEAVDLLEADLAVATAAGLAGARGMTLRRLAAATRGDEGLDRLEEAVATLATTPYRLEHGWALHDLGVRLARRGDRVGAREPLRLALDAATRTESTRLARHVRTELEAAGARPRRAYASGADALTASERRVADLAVSGLTNREIAETLWITPKTVEIHLSRTYGKLGITSRRELPQALGLAAAA
ncbi:LuxR family transcriptional regulator [Cellulomonas endophytica]|uniref:LuxR family transcriptional regulator n=1 Tax=Cellulomonas endophytica TaxID=2494735 RepID=UPI0013E94F51|nr:LuxR family transcriptional regulator [Cellulomonas endophytica]